jgi:hypothetical protein
MKLTDIACRNAKPRLKSFKMFDGDGLYLEVYPSGSKHWRLKYHTHKESRISLGSYPETSLSEAREKRYQARKLIQQGIDPAEVKRDQKLKERYSAEQTFEVVAREWHKENYNTWDKRYADNILHRFEMDVFPEIGRIPVSKLGPAQVYSCVHKIEERGAHEFWRTISGYKKDYTISRSLYIFIYFWLYFKAFLLLANDEDFCSKALF